MCHKFKFRMFMKKGIVCECKLIEVLLLCITIGARCICNSVCLKSRKRKHVWRLNLFVYYSNIVFCHSLLFFVSFASLWNEIFAWCSLFLRFAFGAEKKTFLSVLGKCLDLHQFVTYFGKSRRMQNGNIFHKCNFMYRQIYIRNANTPTDDGKYSSENGSNSQVVGRYSMILQTLICILCIE